MNLSDAMKLVHARRKASGEDALIRQKIRETRIKAGDWTNHDRTEFEKYKNAVRIITDKQPFRALEHAEKRGRGPGKYHLDHAVSKKTGFLLGLPPEFIGDISNLRFIPESANCAKQGSNDIDEITSLWFHLSTELEFA